MDNLEQEVELSSDEREIRDTIHKFAEEVIRPAGVALDALADPQDVVAKDSILWDVFKRYDELGLDVLSDPNSGLTPVQRARLQSILGEERGWGDTGLAISFSVSGFPRALATASGNPSLIERYCAPGSIGCWAITEPDHGSDQINFTAMPGDGMAASPNCVARKDGDSWVISGQKSAWVSNGTIATAAALFCAVDEGDGIKGMGGFLAPLDGPNVRKGKPLNKLGQRALNQGEIYFEDLRIPADHYIVTPELYALGGAAGLFQANAGMGATFVGLAQAAFDAALAYTKERKQGGVPIIQHQSVRRRIFEMFRKVESARALSRRTLISGAVNGPKLEYAIASKVTSTQTAFEVASDALQLFGGAGTSKEYPIEKLFRDARVSMIEDGCNEVLGIAAAARL